MAEKPFCEDCGIRLEWSLWDNKLKGTEWKDGWRCEKCSVAKKYPAVDFSLKKVTKLKTPTTKMPTSKVYLRTKNE